MPLLWVPGPLPAVKFSFFAGQGSWYGVVNVYRWDHQVPAT
jgi:hypothetical protein